MQGVEFLDVLDRLIPAGVLDQMCTELGPRPGSAPKLPAGKLIGVRQGAPFSYPLPVARKILPAASTAGAAPDIQMPPNERVPLGSPFGVAFHAASCASVCAS